jgi:ABC-type transport system involved in multi-copper enzyme maturation permease subunit
MYRGTFLGTMSLMIALQTAGAFLLIVVATLGLRPAWRRHEYDGGGVLAALARRKRPRRRPECGDRPILWKELRAERARGMAWLTYRGLFLALFALLAIGTYHAGRESFADVLANGYRSNFDSRGRTFFNGYIRGMTAALGAIYALTIAGIASEGIVRERVKETWLGLIATPLSGREIFQDKMLGALWRARAVAALVVALWLSGVLGGAVHPLGFLAAIAVLAVSSWFFAALGTYGSLRSSTVASASNATILPVLVLGMTGLLPRLLPESMRSILYGVGSMPLLEYLSLMSYAEVYAQGSTADTSILEMGGISTGEGNARVLVTYALGVSVAAAGAFLVTRLAYRQFDRLVGRPVRTARTAPPDPIVTAPSPEEPPLAIAAGGHIA